MRNEATASRGRARKRRTLRRPVPRQAASRRRPRSSACGRCCPWRRRRSAWGRSSPPVTVFGMGRRLAAAATEGRPPTLGNEQAAGDRDRSRIRHPLMVPLPSRSRRWDEWPRPGAPFGQRRPSCCITARRPPEPLSWRIIFCISANCLSSRLTSCSCVPEPRAMRRLRLPDQQVDGSRRSWWRHRLDDRLDALQIAAIDGLLGFLGRAAHARDHLEQPADRAHLLELLHLRPGSPRG